MARRESKRVMVLRGRRARKARNAFTLCVLLPARHMLATVSAWGAVAAVEVLHACRCLVLHTAASHTRHSKAMQSMPDHVCKARRKVSSQGVGQSAHCGPAHVKAATARVTAQDKE